MLSKRDESTKVDSGTSKTCIIVIGSGNDRLPTVIFTNEVVKKTNKEQSAT